MARNQGIPVVAVVGAGASGSLVALHLVRAAGRRSSGVEIVVIDPADRWGEGVAFSTADERHLLNVPAAGMSALPEDPGHFVSWRRNADPDGVTAAGDFAPRVEFARYLGETLREAVAGSLAGPLVRRVRDRATTVQRLADGLAIGTAAGRRIGADALVLASGIAAPGTGWAVPELRDSAFFVADPWAPGALEVVRRARSGPADVLLVGTGLTMVDVVRSLGGSREDRVLHAVSRHGRLPARHADTMQLAAIPDIAEWGSDLDAVRHEVRRHLATVARATGDWRPAMDGLRFRVSELWARFDEADRERFLSEDVNAWNVARHRMPPQSAEEVAARSAAGELVIGAATVRAAEPLSRGGLKVTLSDGRVREVGWVVNCTGPDDDVRTREDPLLDDLRRPRGTPALAVAATAGMGLRTVQGRLIDSAGDSSAPIWTLGSLRRGELWESTAIPEIRHQALAVATAVLDTVAPPSRRLADGRVVSGHHPVARPRDLLGLPLSTSAEAAASFNEGLERVLRLQSGGDEKIREATQMDPDFAIGHAALAMLGHEAGASADVAASLTAAQAAVAKRGDDRERSWVGVVTQRVDDVRYRGGRALMNHIAHYPRDVLAVSAAVPTIAFSGVTDVQQEAWDLVEGLAPAYGDHWWYISLLAFTRQDQSRFDEAGLLAESALSCEPSSGHAVHALTHVMYETGQHEEGRVWLDHWVEESGRSATHRAHFSWHAALHELALGDPEAVRKRYYSQLAPPQVCGVRGLVDAAALLWRWRLTTSDWDAALSRAGSDFEPAFVAETSPPPVDAVLAAVDAELLASPQTPFVALHAAVALAGAADRAALSRLADHCHRADDQTVQGIVAPVADALLAVLDDRYAAAAALLGDLVPVLARVGGSAAQREVIEETLLFCLVSAGESERARDLLDGRLDRRPSPLDARRRRSLDLVPRPATAGASAATPS